MNPSSAIGRTQSLHSSPDRNQTNQTLPIQIASALESALPGVNASKLVHALDTLLGGRGNYTLVGSAAMHLHALEHPNATCKLPLPNDLDVVVNDTAIRRVELANPETLGKLNLKRDANFAHVLHMTRENAPNLKIDIVRSSTPGFLKYQFNPHSIHNIQVGMLADCLADYKARRTDQEFVEQCGGQTQANAKVQPWLDYFDQFRHEAGTVLPRQAAKRRFTESRNSSPEQGLGEPSRARAAARILKFGS
ncbi:hypothetical protein [Limnobacter sp.]|uniref:hypothetical protein n=1 Tax=Limnobacter sp. TaxID=2003368 RepID=UPI003918DF8C